MDTILHVACTTGDTATILDLAKHNPLILRQQTAPSAETVLHLAAHFGHAGLINTLLTLCPDLAAKPNRQGFSPLHVAAAAGHEETVAILLRTEPGLCIARDRGGRTPVHSAAINGQLGVLGLMVNINQECLGILTDQGETVLHVSGKAGQLEAVRWCVQMLGSSIVNQPDNNGNTVLHLATAVRDVQASSDVPNSKLLCKIWLSE